MRLVQWIVLLGMVILCAGFVALNATPVTVHYFLGQGHFALASMMIAAMIAGMGLSTVWVGFPLLRMRWQNKRLNKRVLQLEAKLLQYREQALKEQ